MKNQMILILVMAATNANADVAKSYGLSEGDAKVVRGSLVYLEKNSSNSQLQEQRARTISHLSALLQQARQHASPVNGVVIDQLGLENAIKLAKSYNQKNDPQSRARLKELAKEYSEYLK